MTERLWHPRHWPAWAGVAVAWLIVHLPMRAQTAFGKLLGKAAHAIGGRRKRITEVNIRMCFPDLSAAEQADLVRRTFVSTGIDLVETLYAWLRPVAPLMSRLDLRGLDVLEDSLAEGRGLLIVGGHFGALDMVGAMISTVFPINAIYRANRNPVVEHVMVASRKRIYENSVERRDVRSIVRLLKSGHALWYAADQDNGRRHSVFAPFFGVEAATITATARFARTNDCPVVFMSHYRDAEAGTWTCEFTRVRDYPTGDDVRDAARLNAMIEAAIRRHPDQYLWLHRRFKTRREAGDTPYGPPRKRSSKRRARASTEKRSTTR